MSGMTAGRAFVVVCVLLASRSSFAQGNPLTAAQPGVQGFSIVLVLGDLQGGPTPDNIPPAARAALGDLKDFLPYKSYRVLDTAWILGSTTQLFRAKSQLRGADDQTYEVSLTSSPVGAPAPPSLQMKFVMQDRSSETFGTSAAQLQAVTAGKTLIDTSFNMRIGETVVVGTSRVRGDKALIALLTAVRK